ncbi:hypothetical protein [Mycoplana dimorpha]|uniref:Uncharacterized protein n=1 Tax=Mycoplana dimorpha TaxID=28320 RepID=A0A2T5BBY1_MYCDI|nr:hypothetical protein [Mycoplana dimorpha]PTM96492.1 hypothetical protein C7449_103511 [Mycoplana dimorpha]
MHRPTTVRAYPATKAELVSELIAVAAEAGKHGDWKVAHQALELASLIERQRWRVPDRRTKLDNFIAITEAVVLWARCFTPDDVEQIKNTLAGLHHLRSDLALQSGNTTALADIRQDLFGIYLPYCIICSRK